MIDTISKIEYGFLTQWFSLMLARNLILVVLEITLLAKICLFGEAVVRSGNVRTFLTDHTLNMIVSTCIDGAVP